MNIVRLFPFGLPLIHLFSLLILLILSLTVSSVLAQDAAKEPDPLHDLLTTRRYSECDDYIFNAQRVVPVYHHEEKFDSVDLVIAYVSEHCSINPFESYLLLRDMLMGVLPPDWCDEDVAASIFQPNRMNCFGNLFDNALFSTLGIIGPDTTYRNFVLKLAVHAAKVVGSTSFQHAVALYLSGDQSQVVTNLSRGQYQNSCLQQRYDHIIDSLLEKRKNFTTNWSVNMGGWIPVGPIDVLGPKVEIGGQAGIRGRRFGADAGLLVRFLNPKQPWVAGHKGKLYETDYFHSIYIGIEPNYAVYSSLGSRLELFAGFGWDGILGLTADIIDEEYGDYQNSYSVNFGLTQRFFYGRKSNKYIGLQAHYNIVDFYTDGGTDLSGNTVSINLLWGVMDHPAADNELDWLGYFGK